MYGREPCHHTCGVQVDCSNISAEVVFERVIQFDYPFSLYHMKNCLVYGREYLRLTSLFLRQKVAHLSDFHLERLTRLFQVAQGILMVV